MGRALKWLLAGPTGRSLEHAVRTTVAATVTLAIVVLAARSLSPWVIAVHRFVEVAAGIVIALIVVAIWPDREPPAASASAAS